MTSITSKRMSADERREQLLDVAKEVVDENGLPRGQHRGRRPPGGDHAARRLQPLRRPRLPARGDDPARGRARPGPARRGDPLRSRGRPRRRRCSGALRGYLETVSADPITWRLVLMPPEGAPAVLRKQITQGRDAVVAVLAELVESGVGGGPKSPDPELTARTISAIADEGARLMLTDPKRYPIERVIDHAAWLLDQLADRVSRPAARHAATRLPRLSPAAAVVGEMRAGTTHTHPARPRGRARRGGAARRARARARIGRQGDEARDRRLALPGRRSTGPR